MSSITPELEAMARAYCWSANRDAIRGGEELHAFVDAHWLDHIRGLRHALRKLREPSAATTRAAFEDLLRYDRDRDDAGDTAFAVFTAMIDHILSTPETKG